MPKDGKVQWALRSLEQRDKLQSIRPQCSLEGRPDMQLSFPGGHMAAVHNMPPPSLHPCVLGQQVVIA